MRGADPLVLFTTLATNERAWSKFTGGSLLDKASPLSPRQRELVIDRTTAKCGCEYEWGVHVAAFASHVGIDAEQVRALVHGGPDDRSEERRVGKECVSTCRSRWSQYH